MLALTLFGIFANIAFSSKIEGNNKDILIFIFEAFYQIVIGLIAVFIIIIFYRFLRNIPKIAKCIIALITAVIFIVICELTKFTEAKYLSMLLLGFLC